jgi:hypothetical protein
MNTGLTQDQTIQAVRDMKLRISTRRVSYLESLPKLTKRDREQLAAERAIVAANS